MPFLGVKINSPTQLRGKRIFTSIFNKDPYGAPVVQAVMCRNAHPR